MNEDEDEDEYEFEDNNMGFLNFLVKKINYKIKSMNVNI